MLQLSEFVWTLLSSVLAGFNHFLLLNSTERSKISSNQKRLFFAVNLYPLSFFANTPFKGTLQEIVSGTPYVLSGITQIFSNRFQYNRWQRRICTLSVQLYSDVTSVNSVFVSDKIIYNSDNFLLKCLSYSKTSNFMCFYFLFLQSWKTCQLMKVNFVFLVIFYTCDVVNNWSISLLPSIV